MSLTALAVPSLFQQVLDATVRHADQETLYDQPYVDQGVVRVTGPFTVESLSPHRVIDAGSQTTDVAETDPRPFIERIIQYLRKAGVQNLVKGEKLVFERLDTLQGGVHVQAVGEYLESGIAQTVAVTIGPEYG